MDKLKFANVIITGNTTITIPSGQTTSSVFFCGGAQPRELFLPSNFTTCNITFKTGKFNDSLYTKCDVDGTIYTVSSAQASTSVPLLAYVFDAAQYFQVICSSSQSSDVTIDLSLMPIYQGIHN